MGRRKKEVDLVEQIKGNAQLEDNEAEERGNIISSASTLLDLALGGGYPIGKIINIVGDKSTGKTLLAIECIAQARKIYGDKLKWFYDDAEAGFSFDTKKLYGFSIVADDEECSYTIEDFDHRLKKELDKLADDEFLIYVMDSLDSLTSMAELKREEERNKALEAGKDFDKGTYGLEKQKFLSQFFRLKRREIKNKNCLLIIISQVRTDIGAMFGDKQTRTGGKALDFYASQIIWLSEIEKHKSQDRVTGITIKAKVKKNKIGKPFRNCYIDLLFDYGVDDVGGNISFLYDLKTESGKSRSQKIVWEKKEYTPKRLIQFIEENNLEQELKNLVKQKWDGLEEQISSKERKSKWE